MLSCSFELRNCIQFRNETILQTSVITQKTKPQKSTNKAFEIDSTKVHRHLKAIRKKHLSITRNKCRNLAPNDQAYHRLRNSQMMTSSSRHAHTTSSANEWPYLLTLERAPPVPSENRNFSANIKETETIRIAHICSQSRRRYSFCSLLCTMQLCGRSAKKIHHILHFVEPEWGRGDW